MIIGLMDLICPWIGFQTKRRIAMLPKTALLVSRRLGTIQQRAGLIYLFVRFVLCVCVFYFVFYLFIHPNN